MEALTKQQQSRLNKAKVQLRIDNEEYLRAHPELQTFVSLFMKSVLEERPDDVLGFACKFFSDPEKEELVMSQVGAVGFEMNPP